MTFCLLIFMGCGAALVNKTQPLTIVGVAMVWGLLLMALAYTVGHVSGCHLNPAVTIAFAADRKFPCKHSKILSGVAIGFRVLFNAMVAGPITGASMNPARSFGPDAVTGVCKSLWVYIVAPVLRALAATALYNVLRVPEPVKSDPKDNTSTSMKFNRSLANTKMSKDYPGPAKQNGK